MRMFLITGYVICMYLSDSWCMLILMYVCNFASVEVFNKALLTYLLTYLSQPYAEAKVSYGRGTIWLLLAVESLACSIKRKQNGCVFYTSKRKYDCRLKTKSRFLNGNSFVVQVFYKDILLTFCYLFSLLISTSGIPSGLPSQIIGLDRTYHAHRFILSLFFV